MFITKKSMLSTAVKAALIGAITIPMVGCDDAETYNQQQYVEAAESFTQQQRQQLVGNVQGVVLDSNGNPLADANVSIGTQTTTTDTLGYYAFADVAAVNVALNTDSSVLTAVPLVISVSANGHLSGRTQASPTAISDTQQYIYIDGFTAQAANLYLPELTASVKATLRSEITGEAIANQKVTLEFVKVNEGLADNNNSGGGEFEDIASTYYEVTTDANGAFVANHLPANSRFNVLVEGFRIENQYVLDEVYDNENVDLTTAKEAIVSNWGEIFVIEEIVADVIDPFVREIEGASFAGRLEKGKDGTSATGGLVFNFSEAVDVLHKTSTTSLEVNTIKVVFHNQGDLEGTTKYVTALNNINSNGSINSIQLNLAEAIAPGQQVDVYFERADFVDAGENELDLEDYNEVSDTYKTAGQFANNYIQYTLFGYEGSGKLDGASTITQLTDDSQEFLALSQHNAALVDVINATGAIEQLNDTSSSTDVLLLELANQLATKAGIAAPTTLVTSTAKVKIDFPENTTNAVIGVVDENGLAVNNVIITPDLTAQNHGVNFDDTTVFYIENTAPGHHVTVVATDAFEVVGPIETQQLVDVVAPTTVIQNSYLVEGDKVTGVASEGIEIDGGQNVTSGVAGSLGYPYLTLAPGILDLDSLVDNDNTDTNSAGADIYNADQFNSWQANDIVTAVAFSENVSWKLSSAPVQTQVVSSSDISESLLSSFDIVNDVTANGGDVVSNSAANDFVTFKVDNIFTLANDYDGKELSFNDLIIDSKGVDASAAKVVIRDALPPMISAATLTQRSDKQYLKISFNESIADKEDYTRSEEPLTLTIANGATVYVIDASDVDFSTSSIEIENTEIAIDLNSDLELNNLRVNIADVNGNDGISQDRDYNYDDLYFEASNAIPAP
ncbi:MAG: hypothetical protein ACI935_001166 [Moritella dasanensis]|jgi:hypothetical protein